MLEEAKPSHSPVNFAETTGRQGLTNFVHRDAKKTDITHRTGRAWRDTHRECVRRARKSTPAKNTQAGIDV